MPDNKNVEIRSARENDLDAITAIYGDAVLNGTGSFETEAPDYEEMKARFRRVIAGGFPYIAAEVDGKVVGYAYASPYHTRMGYRYTVESTVYIDPAYHGQGIGKLLLGVLIEICTAGGFRQMIGVVGDSKNASSIHLHRSLGFHITGSLHAVGYKHGQWRDVIFMQRPLGEGESMPPK